MFRSGTIFGLDGQGSAFASGSPVNLPSASTDVLPVVAYKDWEMPHGGGSGPDWKRPTIIPAPGTAAEGRNLSDYDIAAEVEDCPFAEGVIKRECLTGRRRARQFIYDHWRLKKRGYISVDFFCDDCSPVEHYFIEPDDNGTWRIARILEDDRYGFFKQDDAVEIKYRRAGRDERQFDTGFSVLTFLDKSGKEIDSF